MGFLGFANVYAMRVNLSGIIQIQGFYCSGLEIEEGGKVDSKGM